MEKYASFICGVMFIFWLRGEMFSREEEEEEKAGVY